MKSLHRHLMAVALVMPAIGFNPLASAHNEEQKTPHATHATTAHVEAFGQPGTLKKNTRTIAITLSDAMRFSPDTLNFKQGETIRLRIRNAGKLPHEFVLGTKEEIEEHAEMMRTMPDMVHADASSVRVAPGKSADIIWQFSKPGKFFFACLIPGHREAGMEGSVTVTVAAPRAR